jgi:hypothetical protein
MVPPPIPTVERSGDAHVTHFGVLHRHRTVPQSGKEFMPARVEVGARRPFSSILIVQKTGVCGSGAYQVRPKWVTPAAVGVSVVMVSTTSSVMFPRRRRTMP